MTPENRTSTGKTGVDPLHQLKEILLTDDQRRISELENEVIDLHQMLADKERLLATLSPILTDLLGRKIHESRDDMATALAPLMGEAIRKQVEDSKEDVVDALYPIIGRMISRAVAESMKNLVSSINEQINRRLNVTLWVQQLRARFLGVSTGEILLAESASVQIDHLLIIHQKTGLLIAHKSSTNESEIQVIGSMLQVIKSFIEDAFAEGQHTGDLYEIEHSERTIRIESSRYFYLAVVYSGVPTAAFNESVRGLVHKIQNRYQKPLRDYQGDNSQFNGIDKYLTRFLKANLQR
ncbi:MAG TPA: hypothetical protein PKN04_11495 [bacterium]|nr:hypothetical protein [bacterium]HNT66394.1 hypothetical protein [bacterium]HOX87622.1 hypothetical protein [bacterium]HPG47300.1 hypothetical protein [bacterium]HPM99606.1 hypothetical protein [bacterium]